MPLYEYACEKCGKVFEVMQKFADPFLTVHAECGGKVERLLSAPALHFKGSASTSRIMQRAPEARIRPANMKANMRAEKVKVESRKAASLKIPNPRALNRIALNLRDQNQTVRSPIPALLLPLRRLPRPLLAAIQNPDLVKSSSWLTGASF